jgi:hypothetical protein
MPAILTATIFLIAYVPIVAQLVAVISSSTILLEAITHLGTTRQALLAAFMVVMWAVLYCVLLVMVPVAWAVLMLTLLSFRR